jgi:hypothetical protein
MYPGLPGAFAFSHAGLRGLFTVFSMVSNLSIEKPSAFTGR